MANDQFNVLKSQERYQVKSLSKLKQFERDIAEVINRHGLDSFANMPDYILAEYVTTCISSLKRANEEKKIHGAEPVQAG